MAYFLDVFSPETYETFSASRRDVAGFKKRYQNATSKIHVGDKLICYMTIFSRWIGILEVTSEVYHDETPIYGNNDPYTERFKVKPLIWLEKEKAIPIKQDKVWNLLSFTKGLPKNSDRWTARFRLGPFALDEDDGRFLEAILLQQPQKGESYPLEEPKRRNLKPASSLRQIPVADTATVENEVEDQALPVSITERSESIEIQAVIAEIGSKMGMQIWVPRNNRAAVLHVWNGEKQSMLAELPPLNFPKQALRIIEQIDVLWIKDDSIMRAFEVEHTTAIYSGLLRMVDLIASVRNLNIKLHIVAPSSKRNKVFKEILRPTFRKLLEPSLSKQCTYLSYENLRELAQNKVLPYLPDRVLDEKYAEEAE